ncbi:hypothetical protein DIZ76_011897 [Coccidioides immitis]|nr:hypothetical protein DIZ76_011897 [Coccidioides immitis]
MVEHPGDRPEHPPVWVRGGPPYYYHPSRPQGAQSPEDMRRDSTETASRTRSEPSTAPTSPILSSVSTFKTPPAEMPKAHTDTPVGQAQPTENPPMARRPSLAEPRRSSPSTSTLAGQQQYAGLMYQKRASLDEEVNRRKASWREQPVGSNPDDARWFVRWWDTFTRGPRHGLRKE